MRPRGMTLLEQAIERGWFQGGDNWLRKVCKESGVHGPLPEVGQHVEVWLDMDFSPDTGHLRYRDVPYQAEMAVDRHQSIDAMDFSLLKGLNVLIVAQTENNRLALLAERIAEAEPFDLRAIILDDEEDPVRLFVVENGRV